ncbi:MAG: MerR family transcriptional regulator [Nitrospinae bacterium]|nr:MerR family transcriptional regulator [Nitrospinota bacterium]
MAYNTKTVCSLTGLSQRQADYWDRSHFIKPSLKEASGYGSVRLYSFQDLVQLRMAKALIDKGVSLQKIRKAVSYLKKHFPDTQKPLSGMKFLTDGETIFVLTTKNKVVLDTLSCGQVVFSLAIGNIIEELKGQVDDLNRERKYKVSVGGKSYQVVLHPDLEDGGFWVECPKLPGCASQGDTVEEALEMVKDAILGHLEVASKNRKRKKVTA